jgi:hypothetical protein
MPKIKRPLQILLKDIQESILSLIPLLWRRSGSRFKVEAETIALLKNPMRTTGAVRIPKAISDIG